MSLVVSLIAQLLHIALMAAAAPTLVGVIQWLEARLSGRVGPSVLQPWRDLLRLLRKQTIVAESASEVTALAPVICAAATGTAACLVPSFTLGIELAPFADLVMIGGLLALARCSLALAAMDAGTAIGGIGASRTMLLACGSEPALLLVVFVLALLAGSSNVVLIAAMQLEIGAHWQAGAALALAAALPVALLDSTMPSAAMETEFSGPDLALVQATAALRLLVWFNLIGAMFVPYGIAPSGAGPITWAVGLVCWLARTLIFATLLAVFHTVFGRVPLVRAAQMLGIALLFGLLAAVFLFVEMRTV